MEPPLCIWQSFIPATAGWTINSVLSRIGDHPPVLMPEDISATHMFGGYLSQPKLHRCYLTRVPVVNADSDLETGVPAAVFRFAPDTAATVDRKAAERLSLVVLRAGV